jgi:hypothetical protein
MGLLLWNNNYFASEDIAFACLGARHDILRSDATIGQTHRYSRTFS